MPTSAILSYDEVFMQDIIKNRYDPIPRLVYADFLEERGVIDRAHFIRAQCQLSKGYNPESQEVQVRLLKVANKEWIPKELYGHSVIWRNGFIEGICYHPSNEIISLLDKLPITGLRLVGNLRESDTEYLENFSRLVNHTYYREIQDLDLCLGRVLLDQLDSLLIGKRRVYIRYPEITSNSRLEDILRLVYQRRDTIQAIGFFPPDANDWRGRGRLLTEEDISKRIEGMKCGITSLNCGWDILDSANTPGTNLME